MRPELVAVFLSEALLTVALYGSLLAGAMMLLGRSPTYEPTRWRLDALGVVLILAAIAGLALWHS